MHGVHGNMNKYALAALALVASGTSAAAGTDPWSSKLDRDFATLAARVAPESSGVTVSGFLRSSYTYSKDTLAWDDANNNGTVEAGELDSSDIGGVSIDDARLKFVGTIGNFGLTVAIDGTRQTHDDVNSTGSTIYDDHGAYGQTGSLTGGVQMLDAFASWKFNDQLRVQAGRFRTPFLASALRDEDEMLFINRSLLGTHWAQRDEGIQLSGEMPLGNNASWGYALAVQNGQDDAGNEQAYSARLHFTPIGSPSRTEGAVGAPNSPSFTVGVAFFDDDNDNGTDTGDLIAAAVDATFTLGQFAVAAEAVDYNGQFGLEVPNGVGTFTEVVSDSQPFSATFSYRFDDAARPVAEIAVRFEDLDDDEKSTIQTWGLNWFVKEHTAKVQLNYSVADSDDEARNMDVAAIGLTISL